MKTPAAIYLEREKAMVVDDIDIPKPGPTHVVVKQFATGVVGARLRDMGFRFPNQFFQAGQSPLDSPDVTLGLTILSAGHQFPLKYCLSRRALSYQRSAVRYS